MTDLYRLAYPADPDDYVMASTNVLYPLIPLDYEWINNEPGDAAQEQALGALAAPHISVGSFWVGYQNDAVRGAANRPHAALGAGIDHLDELIRRAIAVPKSTSGTAPFGGVSALTLLAAEEVYLGDGVTYGYSDLFEIVDTTGVEVIDGVGAKCEVTATNPAPGAAALKYGFSLAAVQLTIAPAIPQGVNYVVRYGGRGCLAELPRTSLTIPYIAGSQQVDSRVRHRLLSLHGGLATAWTDSWTTTVWDLAYSGLDGRYRKATSGVPSIPELGWDVALDTAGAGSFYYRDGPAMVGYSCRVSGDVYSDAFDSIWAAHGLDDGGAVRGGGGALFLSNSGWAGQLDATELAPNLSNYLALHTHRMTAATPEYATAYTAVTYDGDAEMSWVATEAQVDLLEAGDHFWLNVLGTSMTSVITKHDIVEIYNPAWTPARRAFIVQRLDPAVSTRAYLRELNGGHAPAGATFTGKIRFHSTVFNVSGGVTEQLHCLEGTTGTPPTIELGGLMFAAHPRVESVATMMDYAWGDCAKFLAVDTESTNAALKWGGRSYVVGATGSTQPTYTGGLWGDGSVSCNNLSVAGELLVDLVGAADVGIALTGVNAYLTATTVNTAHLAGGGFSITVEDNMEFDPAKALSTSHLSGLGATAINVYSSMQLSAGKAVIADIVRADDIEDVSSGYVTFANPIKVNQLLSSTLGYIMVSDPLRVKELRYEKPPTVVVAVDATPKTQAIDVTTGTVNVQLTTFSAGTPATVQLTIDTSTVEVGGVYFVSVRGTWAPADTIFVQFLAAGGLFTIKQDGTYSESSSGPEVAWMFMLTCAPYGANKIVYVTNLGAT